MATKYVSSLTGEEMDAALIDMAYHNSEAYAVGTRNGVAVGSSDVTYHNNSKYWAEQVYGYTDRAEDAANRAEAAVPSGTAGAVFFDRAQTLTSAEQAQARANIMAGGSNRNLLDNPWFTVNQRGWTSGTANAAFTVDRWKMSSAFGTKQVTVNADGTITFNGLFFQKFESHFIAGQVVTISYMTADGNVVSTTGTIGTTEGYAVGNAAFGLYYRPSTGVCDFQIQAENITLRACKLELGSVSTLANDAPPEYGTELLKCQYYFVRLNLRSYRCPANGVAINTTTVYFDITLPTNMRGINPTVAITGTLYALRNGSTSALTGVAPLNDPRGTYLSLQGTCTGLTALTNVPIYTANNNVVLDISADL